MSERARAEKRKKKLGDNSDLFIVVSRSRITKTNTNELLLSGEKGVVVYDRSQFCSHRNSKGK